MTPSPTYALQMTNTTFSMRPPLRTLQTLIIEKYKEIGAWSKGGDSKVKNSHSMVIMNWCFVHKVEHNACREGMETIALVPFWLGLEKAYTLKCEIKISWKQTVETNSVGYTDGGQSESQRSTSIGNHFSNSVPNETVCKILDTLERMTSSSKQKTLNTFWMTALLP